MVVLYILNKFRFSIESRDSVVGIATGYGMDNQEVRVQVSVG
jgi:hypothetical protein